VVGAAVVVGAASSSPPHDVPKTTTMATATNGTQRRVVLLHDPWVRDGCMCVPPWRASFKAQTVVGFDRMSASGSEPR